MVSAPALSALWGLLGLALAPLANILITRLPNGEPIIARPILCPACSTPQSLPDIISLPFFLFRRGRCRHRGLPLPGRLPFVEASLALALALVAIRTGWSALLPIYTLYTFVLLLVFFIDLEQRLILNEVVLIAGLAALFFSPLTPGLTWLRALLGGLSYGSVFALLYLLAWALYRRDDALGLGDVKLSILLGLMTGIPRVWVALSLAVLLGALVGIGLLLAGRGTRAFMPYGTSMAAGTFLALLWGEELWNWYTIASTV